MLLALISMERSSISHRHHPDGAHPVDEVEWVERFIDRQLRGVADVDGSHLKYFERGASIDSCRN